MGRQSGSPQPLNRSPQPNNKSLQRQKRNPQTPNSHSQLSIECAQLLNGLPAVISSPSAATSRPSATVVEPRSVVTQPLKFIFCFRQAEGAPISFAGASGDPRGPEEPHHPRSLLIDGAAPCQPGGPNIPILPLRPPLSGSVQREEARIPPSLKLYVKRILPKWVRPWRQVFLRRASSSQEHSSSSHSCSRCTLSDWWWNG
jgi:hypothetical protein